MIICEPTWSKTTYSLAWSPKEGEATFTRTFDSEEERETFRQRIAYDAETIRTWENNYCKWENERR